MGANSKISWTHDTFNPWIGCEYASPGCAHCYAAVQDHRWGKSRFGVGAKREVTSQEYWKKPVQWDKAAKSSGERRLVFAGSMCDIFDRAVPDDWRLIFFDLIDETPNLTWLLLTKRADAMRAWFQKEDVVRGNVWLGVTAEDQEQANKRIPFLLDTQAVVRFVSVEPQIEFVYMENFLVKKKTDLLSGVDWVICGGESGHGARRFNIEWARSLRNQCGRYGRPFFMKQLGSNPWRQVVDKESGVGYPEKIDTVHPKGGDPLEWDEDLRVQQFPEA